MKNESISVVGLQKGLNLMVIAFICFVGMAMVTATAILNAFAIPMVIISVGATALTLLGSIYAVSRYFTEQQIVYNATNFKILVESLAADSE